MKKNYNLFDGADRLEDVKFSAIRVIMDKARAMAEEGKNVISFSAGEPDFNTPKAIKEAAIHALNRNLTHYCSNRGVLKLRKEIAKKIEKDTGVCYNPETEILVTIGGAEAINHAILSSVNPGDEVIIFTPAFVNYEALVHMCGAKVVEIPLQPENGYQIDLDILKSKITEKTKMAVINNPCNPTGSVYSKESLEGLAKLAAEYNFIVFSDEIYSNLTYGDAQFYSIAQFPGMKERSIVLNGFSKTYAMTGWRVGYLAVDERMMGKLVKIHQYTTTSGNTFIQEGLSESMNAEETLKEVQFMKQEFSKRKVLFEKGLDEMPQLSYVKAKGAFYILINVAGTGLTGKEFSRRLLDEKYVATVPADGFGSGLSDYVRISFAASEKDILEGLRRIKELLNTIK